MKPIRALNLIGLFLVPIALALAGCGGFSPRITAVSLDRSELTRYESLEMTIVLEARYDNPYDARQVRLDGVFTAPDGSTMRVPGFWDGEAAWRLRFTPSQAGEWRYALTVRDRRGESRPAEGTFRVADSDLHGWLQVGAWVDPSYSSRYLVYHDGTPFYGLGHCDALNILTDGFDAQSGVRLFDNMLAAGENFVVWWPLYTNSPVNSRYDQYNLANMKMIDLIVADAQQKGIFLIFTIWDHPELRDNTHPWGNGRWSSNGFNDLGDIDSFFTDSEAWAWQENFYRYIIARWGYSPAIGMWQTVSEINGTNAYEQTDPWHARVNAYFVANDPYRHPTTASMSGDVDWPEGYAVMDVPQVHVYDLDDPIEAAAAIASWTRRMWESQAKPNWIGEFGVPGNLVYPELFHNSIWAALASGAAMTPAEWNSGGSWGEMTSEMYADIHRLARFVADIPLAQLNPSPLEIVSRDPDLRGWGLAGGEGGLIWVQDVSLQGLPIADLRAGWSVRSGAQIEINGLTAGVYTLTPYDTWQGSYLEPIQADCTSGRACLVTLPDFRADLALRIERHR
ncbi:MAG: DUF5060 domain-containing protein [Anaerolineales bacterium]